MHIEPGLARVLAARLCHDLGGVVGSLTGTLDLVDPSDPTMLDLARESAGVLRQRLRLYAVTWGHAASDLDAEAMLELLQGSPAVPRVRFAIRLTGRPGELLPAAIVPIALNAALLAAEALPRGGTVTVGGNATEGLQAWPEGVSAAWPDTLLAALAGTALDELLEAGPRRVLTPLLLALTAEAGWRMTLGLGAGPGCGTLAFGPAA